MELRFIKANPSENMTLFVRDAVPREQQQEVARRLMAYGHLHAEQVGFIEPAADGRVRLQMMGGEFCVNATRALAAVLVREGHRSLQKDGEDWLVPIEVSGADGIQWCRVRGPEAGTSYEVELDMPPQAVTSRHDVLIEGKKIPVTLVRFDGIVHLVTKQLTSDDQERLLREAMVQLDLRDEEAVGVMAMGDSGRDMIPLVYVRSTDTLVWERGCGSGTAAVGVVESLFREGSVAFEVRQPGGIIGVTTHWDSGHMMRLAIGGPVQIVAEGRAFLE